MIRHADSPALSTQNTRVVQTLLCSVAKAVDVLCQPKHCVLDLRQNARDPAR